MAQFLVHCQAVYVYVTLCRVLYCAGDVDNDLCSGQVNRYVSAGIVQNTARQPPHGD